jgi:hypothetical protein
MQQVTLPLLKCKFKGGLDKKGNDRHYANVQMNPNHKKGFSMKNSVIIVILFFCFFSFCFAWERAYGMPGYDCANSIIQTHDSCFVFVGSTCGGSQIYFVKIDGDGEIIFERSMGSGGVGPCGSLHEVIETSNGNYVAVGYIAASFGYTNYIFLIKFDDFGDTIWTKTYDLFEPLTGSYGYSVIEDSNNLFVAFGASHGAVSSSIGIMKTDSDGNVIRYNRLFTSHGVYPRFKMIELNNKFYFAAASDRECTYLYVFDQSCDSINRIHYDFYGFWANSLTRTSDNGICIAGNLATDEACTSCNAMLMKVDTLGSIEWHLTYDFGENSEFTSVKETPDKDFLCAGMSFLHTEKYIITLKNDSLGHEIWRTRNGVRGIQLNQEMNITYDESYILCGYSRVITCDSMGDAYVAKLDSLGSFSNISERQRDISTLNFTAFPNPFNSSCQIHASSANSIEIIDIIGRTVAQLKPDKSGNVVWKPSNNVNSGVFFVKIKTQNNTNCEKVLYLK